MSINILSKINVGRPAGAGVPVIVAGAQPVARTAMPSTASSANPVNRMSRSMTRTSLQTNGSAQMNDEARPHFTSR